MRNKESNDPFEERLNGISGSMDVEDLDIDNVWTGIHHRLPRKRNRSFLYAAASIVVLMAVGIVLWPRQKVIDNPVLAQNTLSSISDVSPELANKERVYLQLIDEKWNEVTPSAIDSGELQFIYDELKVLDQLGTEYENELREMGPNEKIIQTILKCYERRLQLLDMLKRESEKPIKSTQNDDVFNQEMS